MLDFIKEMKEIFESENKKEKLEELAKELKNENKRSDTFYKNQPFKQKKDYIDGMVVYYGYRCIKAKVKNGGEEEYCQLNIEHLFNPFTYESFLNNENNEDVMEKVEKKLFKKHNGTKRINKNELY